MAEDECPKVECPPGSPLWMCTFADLMSLLLCFFVLLLSFSVMDVQKYKQVAGSMENAFGIQRETRVTGSPQGDLMISPEFVSTPLAVKVQQQIDEEAAFEQKNGLIETEFTDNGIVVRMKDSLAFDFGKATLRPRAKEILDVIGKVIADSGAIVNVSGHTDNVPVRKGGAYSSNWSLSAARSVAVVEYWINKFKIPPDHLSAVGHADGKPLKPNDTAAGRAANRRVEFEIRMPEVDTRANTFRELKELLQEGAGARP